MRTRKVCHIHFLFTTAVYIFLPFQTIYNTYITYTTNTSEVCKITALLFSITVRLTIIITVKLIIVIMRVIVEMLM